VRRANRFWWRWLVATAFLYATVWVLLTALDTGPRPGHLLLVTVLATAVLALVDIGLVSDGPDWTVDTIQPVVPAGQDTRLGMYTRIIAGHLDARMPDPGLRDRFADLADRLLHQRHGVGLHDPRAAALLGDDVAAILTGPVRRLSRAEIETCVRRIEEL
jgi:hypothetical protein